MRFREFKNVLLESRGLGARKSGEEFVSTTNPEDKIYIDTVAFYPNDAEQFPSYELMLVAVDKVKDDSPGITFNLIGTFKQTDRAFGVAVFDRPGGNKIAFVKPYKSVKLDPTQNSWDNQTGIPGYKYNSKTAVKTQSGLTPQDILTNGNDLGPQDIVAQIAAKLGNDNPLTTLANSLAQGQKLPISIPAPEGQSFTAFRDYFCELLQPIALHNGQYTGNAGEAANIFLGQDGFAGTSINFGTDKTEGLSDSILISADGRKIKVSSKGARGASASAKNLADAARELEQSNSKLLKNKNILEVVQLIEEIVKAGQAGAPLLLGMKYEVIDQEDADMINSWKKLAPINLESVENMAMSKRLKKLIQERSTNTPENTNLFFHALAAVAHVAADHVNKETDFSNAASTILNNGALVQVYTTASEKNGQWVLQSFKTVWPSKSVTGVLFSASKTYYSTGIKGNYTFKILTNGAKPVEDERTEIDKVIAQQQTEPDRAKR
jgi:hypothetical protein